MFHRSKRLNKLCILYRFTKAYEMLPREHGDPPSSVESKLASEVVSDGSCFIAVVVRVKIFTYLK
jgi:hypothetical protein